MKTKIGTLDVTIRTLNPKTLTGRHDAMIRKFMQRVVQHRDCATGKTDPTPPIKAGRLYTQLLPYPLGANDPRLFAKRAKELEERVFKRAGLKKSPEGLLKALQLQFGSFKFTIPYDTLVLKDHPDHRVTLITEGHYHAFDVHFAGTKFIDAFTLMIPFKVTHRLLSHGICEGRQFAAHPFGAEEYEKRTTNFAPRTKDGIRAKAIWRKRRKKELEREIIDRRKAVELIEAWLEKVGGG